MASKEDSSGEKSKQEVNFAGQYTDVTHVLRRNAQACNLFAFPREKKGEFTFLCMLILLAVRVILTIGLLNNSSVVTYVKTVTDSLSLSDFDSSSECRHV